MPQVCFKVSAKTLVDEIYQLGLPDTSTIVITTDANHLGRLTARFIHPLDLAVLNANYWGRLEPGINIYAFGLEDFSPETTIELGILPVRLSHLGTAQPEDSNLSYFFKVSVRSEPSRSESPQTLAG
jgi:hypothetical protein